MFLFQVITNKQQIRQGWDETFNKHRTLKKKTRLLSDPHDGEEEDIDYAGGGLFLDRSNMEVSVKQNKSNEILVNIWTQMCNNVIRISPDHQTYK